VRKLLEYFGEHWTDSKKAQGCGTCDACVRGAQPLVDYFLETGMLLNTIEKIGALDRLELRHFISKVCREGEEKQGAVYARERREKCFWRGLCRLLVEQSYIFDEGVGREGVRSEYHHSIAAIDCPQPTSRGISILRAWQRRFPGPAAGVPATGKPQVCSLY
jgi:hypothetical protein